jgi:hypothetical protein
MADAARARFVETKTKTNASMRTIGRVRKTEIKGDLNGAPLPFIDVSLSKMLRASCNYVIQSQISSKTQGELNVTWVSFWDWDRDCFFTPAKTPAIPKPPRPTPQARSSAPHRSPPLERHGPQRVDQRRQRQRLDGG